MVKKTNLKEKSFKSLKNWLMKLISEKNTKCKPKQSKSQAGFKFLREKKKIRLKEKPRNGRHVQLVWQIFLKRRM